LVLCDEVGTVCLQPVLRLTGHVRRSAVLLKYESKWKQPFAVVNEHWQQTSNVICRIDLCLLFVKVESILLTETWGVKSFGAPCSNVISMQFAVEISVAT